MTAPAGAAEPWQRSYGRRKGRRLRAGQEALLDTLLPRLSVPLPETPGTLDWRGLFPRPVRDLWLEVGFGAGEHLAWQARHNPDVGLIGCEPYVNGLPPLLRRIEEDGLDTIRLHPGDAREVMAALPDACLGRCFVLFADPWPKARHHKRRFIGPETLDMLARLLRDEGELRLASDNPGLIDWILVQCRRHPDFVWTAERAADWRCRPGDWPPTRYEEKAMHGVPAFLRFRRRVRKNR